MSPTFRLLPGEAEADLTEDEQDYLETLDDEPEDEWETEDDEFEESGEFFDENEDEDEDGTDDDAERVARSLAAPRTAQEDEHERRRRRWTPCFTADEAAQTVGLYEDNDRIGDADPAGQNVDRASCIVMLNVGLGRILGLRTKDHPARSFKTTMPRRPRTVRMGVLTTDSVDGALNQLVRQGRATGPRIFDFIDRRRRRAGTLAPESLRSSVSDVVVNRSPRRGCWYAFGLSLVDATHSVMLLVDFTGTSRRIFWLDQFSRGLSREVTTTLDAEITTFTKNLWAEKRRTKRIGVNTTVRLWRLRKPV
jgi:hypothetical protein